MTNASDVRKTHSTLHHTFYAIRDRPEKSQEPHDLRHSQQNEPQGAGRQLFEITGDRTSNAHNSDAWIWIVYPTTIITMKLYSPPLFTLLTIGAIYSAFVVDAQQDPSSYFSGDNNEAYTDWLQQQSYEMASFITSNSGEIGVALHWTTDETKIKIAIAAKATGWVGFGLAESGSMLGADIVMFTAETGELVDSYVLDQSVMPIPDDCQSWTLINSITEGGFVIFEAERLLDTGDSQDRAFLDDSSELIVPSRVIAAWGDSVTPSYHFKNNARSSVRFFGTSGGVDEVVAFGRSMSAEAEGNFTIRASDFQIPQVDTLYQNFCVSAADLIAQGVPLNQDLHVIGIEPIIDPRTTKYIHHFTVAAMPEDWDSSQDCDSFPGVEMAYVWAPGDLPLILPANVGGPLGGNGGFRSYMLEIHYDNPALDLGNLDSSGIRLFYTSKKRQYDLGIFQTADPQVYNFDALVSPDGGLVQYEFDCDGACSSTFVQEPITVIREHLHMHATGVSMFNAQIRGGKVIREGGVQFWDFNQQGNLAVPQEPFEILPGDAFRTTCNYNPKNQEKWGLASSEEMCMAFLFYYPRQMLEVSFSPDFKAEFPFICGLGFGEVVPECEATYVLKNSTTLMTRAALGRTFGDAPAAGSCKSPTVADSPTPTPAAPSSDASSPAPSKTVPPMPVSSSSPTYTNGGVDNSAATAAAAGSRLEAFALLAVTCFLSLN